MTLKDLCLISVLTLVTHYVYCDQREQLLQEYEQAFEKMSSHAWPYIRAIGPDGRMEYCQSYFDKVTQDTAGANLDKKESTEVGNVDESHNIMASHTVWYRKLEGHVRNVDTIVCGTEINYKVVLARSAKQGCVHQLKYEHPGWRIDNETCNFCPDDQGNSYNNYVLDRNGNEQHLKEYEEGFAGIFSKFWPNVNAMKEREVLTDYCWAILDKMERDSKEVNEKKSATPILLDAIRFTPYRPEVFQLTVLFRKIQGIRTNVTGIYCIRASLIKGVFVRSARHGCVYELKFAGSHDAEGEPAWYIAAEVCNFCS